MLGVRTRTRSGTSTVAAAAVVVEEAAAAALARRQVGGRETGSSPTEGGRRREGTAGTEPASCACGDVELRWSEPGRLACSVEKLCDGEYSRGGVL